MRRFWGGSYCGLLIWWILPYPMAGFNFWSNKLVGISFWCLNIGLLLMLALNIFPAGVMQMMASYEQGFFYARSYEFTHQALYQTLTWLRVVGDLVFLVGGITPLVLLILRGLFGLRPSRAGIYTK